MHEVSPLVTESQSAACRAGVSAECCLPVSALVCAPLPIRDCPQMQGETGTRAGNPVPIHTGQSGMGVSGDIAIGTRNPKLPQRGRFSFSESVGVRETGAGDRGRCPTSGCRREPVLMRGDACPPGVETVAVVAPESSEWAQHWQLRDLS